MLDDADAHAEEAIQTSHPLRVTACQVIVDGDDVHAFAFERVQIRRQSSDERLAFTRLHLGDLSAVKHHAADQLHVEMPHVQHALARLANHSERLDEHVVERLTASDARLELLGLLTKLFVSERLDLRFERTDLGDERAEALDFALVLRADDLREHLTEHYWCRASNTLLADSL